jgi:Flp pilus assembly protein TadB
MRNFHALIIATGLCVPSLALAAPSSAPSEPQRAVAAQVSSTQHAQQATANVQQDVKQSDRDRYAAKEAKSGDAKDYRGGDTVVIGASAAVAILAVLLVLVLI